MHAGHLVDLHSEQLVLLCLRRSFRIGEHVSDLEHIKGTSSGKRPLDVISLEELGHGGGTALLTKQLLAHAKVGKELMRVLARSNTSGLLEEHTRRLLVHHNIDAFESWERSLLGPSKRDTRGQQESCSTASLP